MPAVYATELPGRPWVFPDRFTLSRSARQCTSTLSARFGVVGEHLRKVELMARPKYLRIPPDKWRRYQQKTRPDGWRPPWLKLWNGLIDDHRLRTLTPAQRFVYVGLLIVANESENLINPSHNYLGNRLTISPEVVKKAVETLVANGLIERFSGEIVEKIPKRLRNDRSREGKRIEEREKPSAVQTGRIDVANSIGETIKLPTLRVMP